MKKLKKYKPTKFKARKSRYDETKADRWVRQPPSFAVRHDPQLRERADTYQEFRYAQQHRGSECHDIWYDVSQTPCSKIVVYLILRS